MGWILSIEKNEYVIYFSFSFTNVLFSALYDAGSLVVDHCVKGPTAALEEYVYRLKTKSLSASRWDWTISQIIVQSGSVMARQAGLVLGPEG